MNSRCLRTAVGVVCVAHYALAVTPRGEISEPVRAPTPWHATRFGHEGAVSHGRQNKGHVFSGSVVRHLSTNRNGSVVRHLSTNRNGSVVRHLSTNRKAPDDTSRVHWDQGRKSADGGTVQSGDTHNFRTLQAALQNHGRWSIFNLFGLIPCAVVGIPAAIIARDLYDKGKDVWTPEQSDLRVVDIADLGASGMALLRESSHRKFGIMISFAGMLMKTVLLFFLLLAANSGGDTHEGDAPLLLLWCSIFFHTTMCAADFITGLKAWHTESPQGYEWIHQILVAYDAYGMPAATIIIGSLWLCTSWSIADLVLNATAVGWITTINKQFASIMSWSISAHEGRAFVPNQVRIYDSLNTMKYAAWILCFAAIWAAVMVVFTIIRW